MSTDVPLTPSKKKIGVFWWIGGVVLLVVILFFVQLLGPSPKIIVSKKTTFITEPLRAGGLPDYEEYIRQQRSGGVTPENNAATLLMQAVWSKELEQEWNDQLAAEIGLQEMPSADAALQNMYGKAVRKRVLAWLPPPARPRSDDENTEYAETVIGATHNQPWTTQQVPPMAEWLAANRRPLDLILKASERSHFYWPTPALVNGQHESLVGMLPGSMMTGNRHAARGLSILAMHDLGEGRLDQAWQDTLAMYRLSGLMANDGTLVELLVRIAIRGMANHTAAPLLGSPQMTRELAQQIQKDLNALPPFPAVADTINHAERLYMLDAVIQAKTKGFESLASGVNTTPSRSPVDYASIDWNVALRKMNTTMDELVAVMNQPRGAQRRKACDDFVAALTANSERSRQPGRMLAALLSRNARSDLVGQLVVDLCLPAAEAAIAAEDRAATSFALTQLAAALAEFRAIHGKYPATLAELSPAIITQLPDDSLSGKPYAYRRIDDGFLLYSPGPNGKDDGGSNEMMNVFEGQEIEELQLGAADAEGPQIPSGADDISIRIPTPNFKLPKPQLTE